MSLGDIYQHCIMVPSVMGLMAKVGSTVGKRAMYIPAIQCRMQNSVKRQQIVGDHGEGILINLSRLLTSFAMVLKVLKYLPK